MIIQSQKKSDGFADSTITMNTKTITPESDANAEHADNISLWCSTGKHGMKPEDASVVPLSFARQLEIQRDEAMEKNTALAQVILEQHGLLEKTITGRENWKAVAEKLAEAGRPISQMGIPKGSEHDDCKYQVAFYDCPPDFVLWEDGMGHALSVGDCRIANEALAEYSKLTANQQEVHP